MAKNLEEKFKLYCNSENLEINQNQIIVIKKLQDYFNKNFKKPILIEKPIIFTDYSHKKLKTLNKNYKKMEN